MQGPTGSPYCSQTCTLGSTGQCGGADCHSTNVSGLYVCGDPNASTTPGGGAPTPPDNGGSSGGAPTPPSSGGTSPTPTQDTQAPKVVITSPAAQAQLKPSFVVRATVTDDVGVVKVELFVDGQLKATKGALHHDFPLTLQPGIHTLRVVGHDAATKKGVALIQVKVVANTAQPPQNQAPAPPAGQAYGATCASGGQCQSGICANDLTLNQQYCTQSCDPTGIACPSGSDCYPTSGGSYVCAPLLDASMGGSGAAEPEPVGAGMSCSLAGAGAAPSASLGLVLALLLLTLVRRRT